MSRPTSSEPQEVEEGRVVRPERFILSGVSGLAIARRVGSGEQLVGQWLLLLRWRDGSRQAITMPRVLDVDGERVFISPNPGSPPPDMKQGWSKDGRNGWLRGDDPVPPDQLCDLLQTVFDNHLDLPPESAAGTVALLTTWTMLTYVYAVFDAVPYLAVQGPAGSGKSRVMEILAQLAFRPLSTSNITNAALFRSLDARGGTALIDEAERLRDTRSPDVQELLSSLLAGYKRGGSATRCERAAGDRFEQKHYGVFGPKALAGIAGLPPALASRCIPLPMFRSPPGSPKPMLRIDAANKRWQAIRDALHAVAMDYGPDWLALPGRQDVVPQMHGRNYELWQPLLGLASWLDEHGAQGMLRTLRDHAIRSIEDAKEDSIPAEDEMLLRALTKAIEAADSPTAGELLAVVQAEDPATFRNWSPKGVATRLARYGIGSQKSNGRRVFRPSTTDLLKVQVNYGIDLDIDPDSA